MALTTVAEVREKASAVSHQEPDRKSNPYQPDNTSDYERRVFWLSTRLPYHRLFPPSIFPNPYLNRHLFKWS